MNDYTVTTKWNECNTKKKKKILNAFAKATILAQTKTNIMFLTDRKQKEINVAGKKKKSRNLKTKSQNAFIFPKHTQIDGNTNK